MPAGYVGNGPAHRDPTSVLEDGAVTVAKIQDNAVETAKIKDANVTIGKIYGSSSASTNTFLKFDGTWADPTAGGSTWVEKTGDYTATAGDKLIVDTSTAVVITLPAAATLGDEIRIIDGTGQAGGALTMDTFSGADTSRIANTYTGVTGTSSGTGTVGTFTIIVDSAGDVTSVTVVTGGSGHAVDDTITIADTVLGNGGAVDFTMDVATTSALIVYQNGLKILGEDLALSITTYRAAITLVYYNAAQGWILAEN